jgi:hypothetical protein
VNWEYLIFNPVQKEILIRGGTEDRRKPVFEKSITTFNRQRSKNDLFRKVKSIRKTVMESIFDEIYIPKRQFYKWAVFSKKQKGNIQYVTFLLPFFQFG